MLFKSFSYLSLAVLALLMAACASVTDTPNQNIHVATPGATDARCVLATEHYKVVAYPPQTVFMRRMNEPLTVTCQAPGTREKTLIVRPYINKEAMGNGVTAGLGFAYDKVSGALYEYPKRIVVDFTHTKARVGDLPGYHTRDTVSPFDPIAEDMMDRPAQTPQEQGLKSKAPYQEKSVISKEKQPVKEYNSDIERPY